MPKSELAVCIIFAVLLFMGLFRGPMTLVGCGAATLGVLSNVASFSVPFLYGVFAIPTITVNIGSCITQSWVAWEMCIRDRCYLVYVLRIIQFVQPVISAADMQF